MTPQDQDTIYFILHKILHLETLEDRIIDLESKNVELEGNLKIVKNQLEKFTQINSNLSSSQTDFGSNYAENPFEKYKVSSNQNQDQEMTYAGNPIGLSRILNGSQNENVENNVNLEIETNRSDKVEGNDGNYSSSSSSSSNEEIQQDQDIKENIKIFPISTSPSPLITITNANAKKADEKDLKILNKPAANRNNFQKNLKKKMSLKKLVISLKKVDTNPNFKSNPESNNIGSKMGKKPYYTCSFCQKKFTQNSSLTTHLRIHTGEKPYNCLFCSRKFSEISRLNVHKRTHTGEKPFECEMCHKNFPYLQSLIVHKRAHSGVKLFQCPTCMKKFSSSSSRNVHIKKFNHGQK